ncbi:MULTISPECIES: ABC transporter substrate-binding protein [Mycobacterium]|uniref:ABC transporter substrate-binding protein n=1 Tax=Mycobacterium kiyosense TaxID=2871094 RepID=A0A9P3Q6K0_9MYCO|nr:MULTISPECIES: ABC transporter substrate-binding protein [Mycobacterium]BDB39722.1 ABC transporter substrate-binding protein [Mycobacterium kiyosense]BDE11578.1 ABC transporter substrate-binding protein [Mycobacterium sp. 20KCMC460]GLB82338.1 ABC transporter substrate-binding protein [Mycobacterium kiyosense]GLB88955.1 ABC transporter substrate-binding protein [Mycobacterium kiyosense]GLB95553.1 ABC transporter substrate-binding protein [Mycobacterium kiyosense]
MAHHRFIIKALAAAVLLTTIGLSDGCSRASNSSSSGLPLRLGYLTRITHASALVGITDGLFATELGPKVKLSTQPFSQGTEEVTALLSGQLDAAYIGPNPVFNAWQRSGGTAIKIVSGAASGGTSMVVKPGINSAQDLRGRTVADPALGGTQDVSLRDWLARNGLNVNTQGGGDVSIKPTSPESAIVQQFVSNQIAGAIDSAPFDVQLIKAGGVRLWSDPNTITVLVVRQDFLAAHPDAVAALLRAQVQANDRIARDPAAAARSANTALTQSLGKGLEPDVLTASFQETTFTNDPGMASLRDQVNKAVAIGLLKPLDINGLFDQGPLNAVLAASGRPQVAT